MVETKQLKSAVSTLRIFAWNWMACKIFTWKTITIIIIKFSARCTALTPAGAILSWERKKTFTSKEFLGTTYGGTANYKSYTLFILIFYWQNWSIQPIGRKNNSQTIVYLKYSLQSLISYIITIIQTTFKISGVICLLMLRPRSSYTQAVHFISHYIH